MEGNCAADFPFFLKHKSGMVGGRGVEKYKDVGWYYCPLLSVFSSWHHHSEIDIDFVQQCLRKIMQVWWKNNDMDHGTTSSSRQQPLSSRGVDVHQEESYYRRRQLHRRPMFLSLASWYYVYICIYLLLFPGVVEPYGPLPGQRLGEGHFNNVIRRKYQWCRPVLTRTALLVTEGNCYSNAIRRRTTITTTSYVYMKNRQDFKNCVSNVQQEENHRNYIESAKHQTVVAAAGSGAITHVPPPPISGISSLLPPLMDYKRLMKTKRRKGASANCDGISQESFHQTVTDMQNRLILIEKTLQIVLKRTGLETAIPQKSNSHFCIDKRAITYGSAFAGGVIGTVIGWSAAINLWLFGMASGAGLFAYFCRQEGGEIAYFCRMLGMKVCLVLKDFVDMYTAGKLAVRTLQLWQNFDDKYALKKQYNGFITYIDTEARELERQHKIRQRFVEFGTQAGVVVKGVASSTYSSAVEFGKQVKDWSNKQFKDFSDEYTPEAGSNGLLADGSKWQWPFLEWQSKAKASSSPPLYHKKQKGNSPPGVVKSRAIWGKSMRPSVMSSKEKFQKEELKKKEHQYRRIKGGDRPTYSRPTTTIRYWFTRFFGEPGEVRKEES
eukprot:317845_1